VSSEAKPAESYVEKPKTLAELREGITTGRIKATELAASYYERIEKKNPATERLPVADKERAAGAGREGGRRGGQGRSRCRRWRGFRWASRTCW